MVISLKISIKIISIKTRKSWKFFMRLRKLLFKVEKFILHVNLYSRLWKYFKIKLLNEINNHKVFRKRSCFQIRIVFQGKVLR